MLPHFFVRDLFFLKKRICLITLLCFFQSLISFAFAHQQIKFIDHLSALSAQKFLFFSYLALIFFRSFCIYIQKSMIDYFAIGSEIEFLQEWGGTLQERSLAQKTQILTEDLRKWVYFLLQQSSHIAQDLWQLVFFCPLLYSQMKKPGFNYVIYLFIVLYILFSQYLSLQLQKKSVLLEQKKDKFQAYWHARLLKKGLCLRAAQRYKKAMLRLFWLQRVFLAFDIMQQALWLALPAVFFYLSGSSCAADYFFTSQIFYNLLPALTHFATYRAQWAQGLAAGSRWFHASSRGSNKLALSSKNSIVGLAC